MLLKFNDKGAQLFEQITAANVGRTLAIFLDGQPISTPVIDEAIPGGTAVIGNFTAASARDLARNLSFGALPAPISLESSSSVGPTLGAAAIAAGIIAGLIGFAIIALFMILWYRLPGLIAVVALAEYLAFMLAIIKVIPVTLTASGIAGLIISLGMAVDANVLIFERMKEELRGQAGSTEKGAREAVHVGFSRAWTAIRDGHLTMLISGIILFWLGTSIVQGFALVFVLGVLASLVSAVSLHAFSCSPLFRNTRTASKFLHGLGPITYNVCFGTPSHILLLAHGAILAAASPPSSSSACRSASTSRAVRSSKLRIAPVGRHSRPCKGGLECPSRRRIGARLRRERHYHSHGYADACSARGNSCCGFEGLHDDRACVHRLVRRSAANSPLRHSGPSAAVFAIMLYIAWAFRKVSRPVPSWGYGITVVAMLAIDIIVPTGFYAIMCHYAGTKVDSLFVVALLALLGYCVNDVIVIFDRIREHLSRNEKLNIKESFEDTIGKSIDETMRRSINAGLTVALALLALIIYGAPATATSPS